MADTPQAGTGQEQGAWDPIAAARQKFPGLKDQPDDKIGEFVSEPKNFRNTFPEYSHVDDQTITRNMADVRARAPLQKAAPAVNPISQAPQVSRTGEQLAGGGGESARPQRQALVREAGSPLAVPLAAGARALEAYKSQKQQEDLRNAARGTPAHANIPDEANIAVPQGATVPTDTRMQQFAAGSGASALRTAAGFLTPSSQAIAAVAPVAPAIVGTGLALHGGYNALKNAPAAFQGNPEAAEKALNAAAEATGGGALAGEGFAGGAPDINAATNLAKRVFDSAGGLKTLGIIKPEPHVALTRAIQPGVNIPRAQESIPIAGSRLQQVKNAGLVADEEGNPITEYKSNKDLLAGVRAAKQYIWNALEQRTGSVARLQTDTSGAARAMENSISKRTREQYPEIADRIEKRADTYRGLKSFRDIEDAIQDANNDLRNYYKRSSPTDSPITAETAATEAEVKYLRNLLDEKVEQLTGSGTKELKREYGALRDVERAAAKQYAIETRQKGATLWEGLAYLRAAGDFVSGNILGAAKGAGTIAMGKRLANVRSPAWNIDQAFQGPKAFKPSAEIAPPPGPKIAGQLPPAPTPNPNIINGEYAGEKPYRTVNVPGPNERPIEMPPNPVLPAGPRRSQLTGPEAQKALPAARQIQVGPSSLPPESAPKPPAPKAPPTNGAIKAAREEMAKPTEKAKPFVSKKAEQAPSKPVSEYAGANATPEMDKLADAIMEKRPGDRLFAHQRAEEIETILANPERYYPEEVETARDSKKMWLGPERRKTTR
jgi:hypothetical protein